jgi:hypothetical protein
MSVSEEPEDAQETLQDEVTKIVSLPEATVQEAKGEEAESKALGDQVLDRIVKKMEPPLASKLSKAQFRLAGDKLVLTLNGGDALFADSIKKNAGLIEQIFSEELGSKIRMEIETAKKKSVRKKDLKEEVMADPVIREVLELFEGRIVDVTPIKEDREY